MRVLIIGETSGVIREAFRKRGHSAWSNDLLPADDGSPYHIQGDGLECARSRFRHGHPTLWDLIIAHPTCTFLCNSGIKWLYRGGQKVNGKDPARWTAMRKAAKFYNDCLALPCPRIAVENPRFHPYAAALVGATSDNTQYVQPYWFGEKQFKATGWRLKNLPRLTPTNLLVPPKPGTDEHKAWSVVHRASPGPDRWKERSRTLQGPADALAEQWGSL